MKKLTRPDEQKWAELCARHTKLELAQVLGVSFNSIQMWQRDHEARPLHQCCGCGRRGPRAEFRTSRICEQCVGTPLANSFKTRQQIQVSHDPLPMPATGGALRSPYVGLMA